MRTSGGHLYICIAGIYCLGCLNSCCESISNLIITIESPTIKFAIRPNPTRMLISCRKYRIGINRIYSDRTRSCCGRPISELIIRITPPTRELPVVFQSTSIVSFSCKSFSICICRVYNCRNCITDYVYSISKLSYIIISPTIKLIIAFYSTSMCRASSRYGGICACRVYRHRGPSVGSRRISESSISIIPPTIQLTIGSDSAGVTISGSYSNVGTCRIYKDW